jgi:hypothetical protein
LGDNINYFHEDEFHEAVELFAVLFNKFFVFKLGFFLDVLFLEIVIEKVKIVYKIFEDGKCE